MKKRITSVISFILGIVILGIILNYLGLESFEIVRQQAQPIYLVPYFMLAAIGICFLALKLKYILRTYGQKVPFSKVLKHTVAGFAFSYVTPTARAGGEPLKAYMLNKEAKVPFRVGGSSVVIDKFIEMLGVAIVAVLGLFLLFLIPGVSIGSKIALFSVILVLILLLFFIYFMTLKGKGPFTTLFNLLRFYKFKRFQKASKLIKNIEERMKKFFVHHKKEFFVSFLIYVLVIIAGFLEFKFLLLALGVDASLTEIILAHVVLGITSFIPVPAGLGFQEAGHSGLFALLRSSAGLGLVFSLIVRIRNLIITGIGFIIIANFGSKEIIRRYYGRSK